MKKIVLFDGHNLLHRCMYPPEVNIHSENPNYNHLFFLLFNSMYFSIFRNDPCSEVIYCNDSSISWRKLYFPRYKESRKLKKDDKIDWNNLFKETNKFLEDVRLYLPFKVLHIKNCEADDLIGTLALHPKNNRKYTIISTDSDFLQLTNDRVSVYNPNLKEYNKKINTEEFLNVLYLNGQKKDDIFNVLTNNDYPIGKRKPSFGEKKAQKIVDAGKSEEFIRENKLEENFKRNQVLIDLHRIPKILSDRILDQYNNYKLCENGNVKSIFKKYDWSMNNFDQIEKNLERLWKGKIK